MKHRFLLLFAVLMAAINVSAYEFEVDGIYYNVISQEDLTCEVTYKDIYYNSYSGDIVIPSTVNYNGRTFSVTEIGYFAFQSCFRLTSVKIPNSVTWIGGKAFAYCSILESVTIPNSVTEIDGGAFDSCESLTSVTIPNSVTTIGGMAFSDCTSLTSVEIPNSVTEIGDFAFWGCISLTSVTIGNSVTSIGYRTFYKCTSLTSVTIPNSVTWIGGSAFEGCSSLTSVTIPNSVTEIGENAFENCTRLKKIISLATTPPRIYYYTFSDVLKTEAVVKVPTESVAAYQAADYWNEFQNIVEIPVVVTLTDETTVNTANLVGQDLSDNIVDNVYYNLNGDDSGFDSSDGSIVIGRTTNMAEIVDKEPGSADVTQKFNGMILKVAKGTGIITVNAKTTGNAQLAVQVGNNTPLIATKDEKGDMEISYDVEEDSYVYIYAIIDAPTRSIAADNAVIVYGLTITPGATSIQDVDNSESTNTHYYDLGGRRMAHPAQGLYIVNGQKVVVK